MQRVAFTIILNGLHHLLHNSQAKFILHNFDLWIVVEGASRPGGSTRWCRSMPSEYHNKGLSIDGTSDYLENLSKLYNNILHIKPHDLWPSKDTQVNTAIKHLRQITNKCYLWQIDADEQWDKDGIATAEKELSTAGARTGLFFANYYVGPDIIAKGDWGEKSTGQGYPRLWLWSGEYFDSHEPPKLSGEGKSMLLSPRFNHYSYYFEQDVKFKENWYTGHENVYNRWKYINSRPSNEFPLPLSLLISGHLGNTPTFLHKVDNQEDEHMFRRHLLNAARKACENGQITQEQLTKLRRVSLNRRKLDEMERVAKEKVSADPGGAAIITEYLKDLPKDATDGQRQELLNIKWDWAKFFDILLKVAPIVIALFL